MDKQNVSLPVLNRRHLCAGVLGVTLCSTIRVGADTPVVNATRVVNHSFGSTEIPAKPQRIVALGWNCEDIILALGDVPVAMEYRGMFDSGILPWNEALLGENRPVILPNGMADYEDIAAVDPDLIIVLSEYYDVQGPAYQRLRQIAPTVVYKADDVSMAWKEQTAFIGDVIGRSEEAAQVIRKTEAFLQTLSDAYPEIKGKTFFFGTFGEGSSGIGVYLPTDPRVAMLENLGLRNAPGVVALGIQNPEQWMTAVSLENIDILDSDVAIIWNGSDVRQAVESSPLLQQQRAIKNGHCVYIDTPDLIWASSALSILSMPYAFDAFFRLISESLAKK